MAKLDRKQQKIFASDADSTQVTAFRTAGTIPTYSKDVDDIQNEKFTTGWLDEDNTGNVIPYAEDMNGVFYAFTRNLAYLYQQGIPEWSNSETYYLNAMCMYNGVLYQSLANDNTNKQPDTQTTYWEPYASPVSGSVTGAENLGTGSGVYAQVASSKIQLKSLVAGTNVTLTEASDSITISASGGGGSSTVAWGNITGSIASQTDLATALSQRGTLSGNNSWTGTNTVRDLIPSSNATYDLGSSTYAFSKVFSNYILSNANDHLILGNSTDLNRVLVNYITNGGDWGIFPDTISGTDSNLGNSVYSWDNGYITTINTSEIDPISTSISIDGDILPKNTTNYSIGGKNNRWSYVYTNNIILGDSTGSVTINHNFIGYLADINSYRFRWYSSTSSSSDDTQELFFDGNNIRPGNSAEVSLGDPTHYFNNVYGATYNLTSNVNLTSTASGNAMRLTWYDTTNAKSRGLNLVDASLRPSNTNEVSLGDQYGLWKDLHLLAGSTGGIYFGTDASHSYIRDVTSNTLLLHATDYVVAECPSFRPQGNSSDLGQQYHRWSTIWYTTLNPPSDIRLKENIEPLESGLKIVNDLDIKSFTFKNSPDHIEYGIIAQEVVEKYPELISVPDSDEGTYGTYLHNFIFASIRAIQELSAKVDELQNKLNTIGVKQ